MARIRTIKPEFWKSEDIACHDFFTRLVFIGLWTYVDDNGVGVDNYRLIAAELFPLEDDFAQVSQDIRESLARLSEAGRVLRYTVDGKSWLAIANWKKHQRIDKPNKARYPEPNHPDATPTPPSSRENVKRAQPIREGLDTPSRGSRESPAPGTEEQRNRGTGEKNSAPATPSPRPAPIDGEIVDDPTPVLRVVTTPTPRPAPTTAQELVAEWIEHCAKRPPGRTTGHVAKEIKALLDEGIDANDVRAGLAKWHQRGLHPSVLPSVVNEVMNATPAARRSTTDERVAGWLAIGAEYAAEAASKNLAIEGATA